MASRARPDASVGMAPKEKPLPPGYCAIQEILAGQFQKGSTVRVVGLVRDSKLPMMTRGTDWKSALTLYDRSTEDDGGGVVLDIFRPQNEMPETGPGDIVILWQVKVQNRSGSFSLITTHQTSIFVFSASRIPRPPKTAKEAMVPPKGKPPTLPNVQECGYVAWLYHNIEKCHIPDVDEYRVQTERTLNIRDKFSILKDMRESTFYDAIVQVVKDPWDEGNRVSFWVTDYTENEAFFLHSWDGTGGPEIAARNPYGYPAADSTTGGWPGPFGKRSMQVTAWEPHAGFMRESVKGGDWVKLRNLRAHFGNNHYNLEGALDGDRKFPNKILVERMETDPSSGQLDDRLKDAIRRKRDYERDKKKQQKSFRDSDNTAGQGTKRKADDEEPKKLNSKQKRAQRRENKEKEVEEQRRAANQSLGLNTLIKCESEDQPLTPLSGLLQSMTWQTTVEGESVALELPFVCAKYRTTARVVDYRPRKLVDFACSRKQSEYDALSDNDDADDDSNASGSDSDIAASERGASMGRRTWEWRFALQLEEANAKGKDEPARVWVVVDNIEAQQLMNVDACDLRADPDALDFLRERLFMLWGNLEELRQRADARALQDQKRVAAGQPPPDSSPPPQGGNEAEVGGGGGNPVTTEQGRAPAEGLSNKPFACCVRQYGVRVSERDPARADAGEGRRWKRVFGLFGTKIAA